MTQFGDRYDGFHRTIAMQKAVYKSTFTLVLTNQYSCDKTGKVS